MLRRSSAYVMVVLGIVGLGRLTAPTSASSQSGAAGSSPAALSAPPGVAVTPADVAQFLGDWTIPITSTVGSYTGYITLKVEAKEVVALLSADVLPEQRSTDIVKAGKGIAIRAKMDYKEVLVEKPTPVSVVVTLTPAGDYINVGMDFKISNKSFFITSTAKRAAR